MPKCILWHGILLSLQSRFHKMNKEKQCSISKKWKNWSLLNKQTRMNEKISFLFWHEKRKWTLAREWAREQKSESVKNQAKLFVIEYLCGIFFAIIFRPYSIFYWVSCQKNCTISTWIFSYDRVDNNAINVCVFLVSDGCQKNLKCILFLFSFRLFLKQVSHGSIKKQISIMVALWSMILTCGTISTLKLVLDPTEKVNFFCRPLPLMTMGHLLVLRKIRLGKPEQNLNFMWLCQCLLNHHR